MSSTTETEAQSSQICKDTVPNLLLNLVSRTSLEHINSHFRSSLKEMERDLQIICGAIEGIANNENDIPVEEKRKRLEKLISKLNTVKTNIKCYQQHSEASTDQTRTVLRLFMKGETPPSNSLLVRGNKRPREPLAEENKNDNVPGATKDEIGQKVITLDPSFMKTFMISDYLSRTNQQNIAIELLQKGNMDIGANILQPTLSALQAKNTIALAIKNDDFDTSLRWCSANRSKLRKISSELEFKIRERQVYLLVASGDMRLAIEHIRSRFTPLTSDSKERFSHLKKVFGYVALGPSTVAKTCPKIDDLVELFRRESWFVFGLPKRTLFESILFTGLASLNTNAQQHSNESGTEAVVDCPCCQTYLAPFVSIVAKPQVSHSLLLCPVLHERMDENNPPVLLTPTNVVFSANATKVLQIHDGFGNKIRCPITGEEHLNSEIRKVFLL